MWNPDNIGVIPDKSTGNKAVHKANDLDNMKPVDRYVTVNSLREIEVLSELREHTFKNVEFSIMLTDPLEAQFFRLLLKSIGAKKCMEVGAYTGYNVLSCALTIPEDGIVYALDICEKWVNHGKAFFEKAKVNHKIDIRIAPASETMDKLINEGQSGTFDFIYVDADKPGYLTYLEKGLVLLRQGGILAFDNTLQSGRVVDMTKEMRPDQLTDAKAIHAFNEKVRDDKRVDISFLRMADGVTLCHKL